MTACARLGLAVGAFFFATPPLLGAQVVVPPGSEVPIPPKPASDSVAPRADTIQPPFGRRPANRTSAIGPLYEWDREAMFASGALTLADLLERLPEVTSFRPGWLATPKLAAVNGDFEQLRIFYDGVELDNVDPRSGRMVDLTTVDLWPLEHVALERMAGEVRVHLRSWRVVHTDPNTRTDVFTGDENTNIYRGFYGKRFRNGAGLQLGGQQYGTRARRLGGGGDALSFIARTGVARRTWSVDAFAFRRNASRTLQPTFGDGLSIPSFQGTWTVAYLRAAGGNAADGAWVEAIASTSVLSESSPAVSAGSALANRVIPDTTDTTTKRQQYLATAGYSRGAFRVALTHRIRSFSGDLYHAPSARLELHTHRGGAALLAERDGFRRESRVSARANLQPLPFLAVNAAAFRSSPDNDSVGAPPRTGSLAAFAEAGLRIGRGWLLAGFITRDTAILAAPTVFDTAYAVVAAGRRQGLYWGARGRVYRDINADVIVTHWDSAGFYQPRYQARSELNIVTRWLSRFPSGNFGLKAAIVHEYRGNVSFPMSDGRRIAASSSVYSALLEIRILSGVASYQIRNMAGINYQIVPDFFMPRAINIYGLRWEFWN